MSSKIFTTKTSLFFVCIFLFFNGVLSAQQKKDSRMDWWRDARFGMFIHWGLYAVPAGEWNGQTNHAEWIRTTAQIPLKTYNQFLSRFNPVQFDAKQWVKMAKDAGMKYIVITSKHHDGFALFDSKNSDFDVMSTPFKTDILKELANECEKQGIQLCFYHSIMDWHHPDYLPRRDWEKDRSDEGANLENYISYMKAQLKELLTNYGKIGVLWFDGEWEKTWTHERGKDLYDYVRSLQPDIIINNRVDIGRQGMQGLTKAGEFAGDFGTPEQEIPATGIPGTDWESCMTMNDHWGYNSRDKNWKTSEDLIHKLIDISSKGGNFLLNVGPTAEGVFPDESVQRLKEIGSWMKMNSESIYSTSPSPFKNLSWGRCTQKSIPGGTRLYLHIFDWPQNNKLIVPGLGNQVSKAYALYNKSALVAVRSDGDYSIDLSKIKKQELATVIVLDIRSQPIVYSEPEIISPSHIFTDELVITIKSSAKETEIRYTLDGKEPAISSPKITGSLVLKTSATVKAKSFHNGKAVSSSAVSVFEKRVPIPAKNISDLQAGLLYSVYKGKWSTLPDFSSLTEASSGVLTGFDIGLNEGKEEFGYTFKGFINIPADGVYTFYISSDDGSRMLIGDNSVVDNDGLHAAIEKSMELPLAKGYHRILVDYFQATGGSNLDLAWKGPNFEKTALKGSVLFSEKGH